MWSFGAATYDECVDIIFFFKQKTAYEIKECDWSSDVCSSDLFEIQNSGYQDKLAAGLVLTGGGSLLKHLPQLVKFKMGYDVRIGYPNLHIAGEVDEQINQPMFATSIGLVLKGFEYLRNNQAESDKKGKIPVGAGDEDDPEMSSHRKKSILEKFKNTLVEIFAENDMNMN